MKTDLFDNKLSTTLALYDITRTNLTTRDPDPNNSGFSIQTGEQKSQGIELNMIGEILPGWSIIASYNYTNARITRDNQYPVGNRLNDAPEHSASLWTTYTLQKGDLKGLGVGLGVFYVGDRFGDLTNTYTLPSYFRTDAAIYYRQRNLQVGLNFKNLFDILYYETATNDVRIDPGDPFEAQLSVSWEF